tara:strand:+ start:975 stop:1160 length:186 start_codon:yes stop_codon:yes gene_type:complete
LRPLHALEQTKPKCNLEQEGENQEDSHAIHTANGAEKECKDYEKGEDEYSMDHTHGYSPVI